MQATANPGLRQDIAIEGAQTGEGPRGFLIALAFSLLDGEVAFYMNGDDAPVEEITLLTGSRFVSPCQADFIFVSDENLEMLGQAKTGTLEDPHLSATVIILTEDKDNKEYALECPGIPPKSKTKIPYSVYRWLKAREALNIEYPCGIDLIFYTPQGCMVAFPRLCREV